MTTFICRCLAFGFLFSLNAWGGQLLALSERLQPYVETRYGVAARQRLERWQALMTENSSAPASVKLALVNRFFNQIPYVTDQVNWGAVDYWATPFELLAVNGGDCEDYAIAKYFSLIEMGVPAAQLQISYVMSLDRGEAHMVLAYLPSAAAEALILDNLTDGISTAAQRPDLARLYAFNLENLWTAPAQGRLERVGRPERIAQWMDLLVRMNREMRRGDIAARATAKTSASFTTAAGGPPH
jgi:hypothetical protein